MKELRKCNYTLPGKHQVHDCSFTDCFIDKFRTSKLGYVTAQVSKGSTEKKNILLKGFAEQKKNVKIKHALYEYTLIMQLSQNVLSNFTNKIIRTKTAVIYNRLKQGRTHSLIRMLFFRSL